MKNIAFFPVFVCAAAVAFAQGTYTVEENGKTILVHDLTVTPAVPKEPYFIDDFIWPRSEVRDSNAAFDYYRAMLMACLEKNDQEEEADLLSMTPLATLDIEKAKKLVAPFDLMFRYLERASRNTYCQWQYRFYDTENPISELVPEAKKMSVMSRFLAVKARVALAEKRYGDAMRLLRIGFSMARHEAESGEIYISVLNAVQIQHQMLAVLRDGSRLPDTPNVFWPLKELYRFTPLSVTVHRNENDVLFCYFPEAPELYKRRETLGDAQWREAADRFVETCQNMAAWDIFGGWETTDAEGKKVNEFNATFGEKDRDKLLTALEPIAREGLSRYGYSAEQIEKMPRDKAVALDFLHALVMQRAENTRRSSLTFEQEKRELEKSDLDKTPENLIDRFAWSFQSSMLSVKRAMARADWMTDMALFTEALRWYAAIHEGSLPRTMTDFGDIPVPENNPVTNKPYTFRVENDALVFDFTESEPVFRYVIKLAK